MQRHATPETYPSVKHFQLKTLAIAMENLQVKLEPESDDMYLDYTGQPRTYGNPVEFCDDPSSFTLGSDQMLGLRSLPKGLNYHDVKVMDNAAAKALRLPIFNLILTCSPQNVVSVLLNNKEYLRKESTILFMQRGRKWLKTFPFYTFFKISSEKIVLICVKHS